MLHSSLQVSVIVLILFQGLLCLPSYDVYKCENKSEWKLIDYGTVGIKPPRAGAKILQAVKDSCVAVPFKIEAESILELIVYVNTTTQESGITILVFNEKQNVPAVDYTYGKTNKDFSLGWHTILLAIENDIDGYICLLGSSQDNEAALIDSVLVYKYDGIRTEDNDRGTTLRIHDSIKNHVGRINDDIYNYSNKTASVSSHSFYNYNIKTVQENDKLISGLESVIEIENNKNDIKKNKQLFDVKDNRQNKEYAYKYDSSNGNDENINRKNHWDIIEIDNTSILSNTDSTTDNYLNTDETTTVATVTEESTTPVTTTEDPTTEDTTTEDPATEDPATEDPATEDPATEDPATEDPATEDPATEDPATGDNSFWTPLTIGLVAAGSVVILAVVFAIAYNCGKEKGIEQTYGNLNGVKAENIIDPPSKRIVPRVKNIYKDGENPSNRYNWYD